MKGLFTPLDRLRPYRVLDRPIFLLSAPRSGSTLLFDLLCRFRGVWAWHAEMDDVWWAHFPPERLAAPSDHVGAEDYNPAVARRLRRALYRHALWAREQRAVACTLGQWLGAGPVRYVEKTVANCFHLGFLKTAFPQAKYLFLVRDARAAVSSMMEAWDDVRRFGRGPVQRHVRPAPGGVSHWSFPAPPGWQDVLDRPLEEVCAWSWCRHVESVSDGLRDLPPERRRTVTYEDLVAAPEDTAREIADFCGLAWQDDVTDFVARRPFSRTTVSPPGSSKWQRLHGDAVRRVLPGLAPVMAALGYDV